MRLAACFRGHYTKFRSCRRANGISNSQTIYFGKSHGLSQSYNVHSLLEEVEDDLESISRTQGKSSPLMSLAKSLACLSDESFNIDKRSPLTRMEQKRLIELRIKKRVKAEFLNGKFYNLMHNVVANADTLKDAYDIIRLNSNIKLTSTRDDVCFHALAEELASGSFDAKANSLSMFAKTRRAECLVLPGLKLKVIKEAIRVVLEVVFRPHFSRVSHGCRSGRGHQSALRFLRKEICLANWCFTVPINKEADANVVSRLISELEERIVDAKLAAFLHSMFEAKTLNLFFGGFPKGHGLPQEGGLSPILMNIYLDIFDREMFGICMKYEGLDSKISKANGGHCSTLRRWVRRQMKDSDNQNDERLSGDETRIYTCRFMDEIFIAVFGSKDVALNVKSEIMGYLNDSLYLDVDDKFDIETIRKNSHGLQFAGSVVRATTKETAALRAVHKLKDKVRLFASQKQEVWDAMNLRIGKKWLAYALRRIKESEIKNLGLSTPLLDHISQFRKEGMKTDHWFKTLLKIWMQDVNAQREVNEEILLSKYIAEPVLPQDLRDAFYNFQNQAKDYVLSETSATLALLSNSKADNGSTPRIEDTIIRIEAPINFIKKSLQRYGLVNIKGFARHVSTLVLQDDDLIIAWFSGLVKRWLKWYSEFDNFVEVKHVIVECVRKSCIRTLAAKYRMHENLIEKRFELDKDGVPMTEDFDAEIIPNTSNSPWPADDEALMYGISCSGLCVLSLSRVKVPARVFNCFVMGCTSASPSMYTLHVREKQRFPGQRTGFSTSIHASLNGRRIGLCKQHVKDLYLGNISLQSVEFGALSR